MKILAKWILVLIINGIMVITFNTDFVKSNHFNFITVNSVFIGFLFTSLSMMMGFLNEKVVQFFEEAGALKKVYDGIQKGILFSIGSIFMSILNLTIIEKHVNNPFILKSSYSFELLLLIITLYFLFITIMDLKTVVDSIRIDKIKKKENDQANKELEKLFDQK